MGINRYRRKSVDGSHIGEVLAEAFFVDAQIVGERQQDGGDHAVRDVSGMAGHCSSPRKSSSNRASSRPGAACRPPIATDPDSASAARPYIMPGPAFAK